MSDSRRGSEARPPDGEDTGSGVRTFLIADVRGYTHFTQAHGDEAAAQLTGAFASTTRAVAMEGSDIETQLGLVSADVGISLQPASFARLGRAGVAWRQLAADAPTTSSVQLAWCEPPRTPVIASTLKIAHDVVIEQRIARSTSSNRRGPRNQSTVVPGGAVHGG